MIRLAGLKPDEDIKITYTGLRHGEKLHEELFSEVEELMASDADGVQLAKSLTVDLPQLQKILAEFVGQLQAGTDEKTATQKLADLVPEFNRDEAELKATG
jgi:O-antigen biosynthesis protein WbqV